ncbi:cell division protein FtsW (lipid II flippase) [Xanthomonas sacchari]|uniref:hypothetical protein n=1 Tax=Xanthomonas sacchari TaxID=56458 RepID=UPI002780B469|nr:hypothetical protein [Xanthomonas sacchari]MDQ1090735.1 cell division protein FtsW (lipid II flippase) [Xanthomonas sacchari]
MSHGPLPPASQAASDPLPGALAEAADQADMEAGNDPLPRWLVGVGVVLTFLLVGPPLGTVVVGLPVAIAMTWREGSGVSAPLLLLLLMAMFSYVFGALPALLTGLFAARAWPRLRGWRAHLRIGLIGAGTSAVCVAAVLALFDRRDDPYHQGVIAVGLCALAGFVGATLLSRALQFLRRG